MTVSNLTTLDINRNRLERELQKKGFNRRTVIVGKAAPNDVAGSLFLQFAEGGTAAGDYERFFDCIVQARQGDIDSLKGLLRDAELLVSES